MEIQRLWLALITSKLHKGTLPKSFRDQALIGILHQSKWSQPGSSHFQNLDLMANFLTAVCQKIDQGYLLVLNFVFQHVVCQNLKINEDLTEEDEGVLNNKAKV